MSDGGVSICGGFFVYVGYGDEGVFVGDKKGLCWVVL